MSEELGFKGRVVIVTGSSKGIGRALATMFAARGAKVIVNGRKRGPVEETVAELLANGGEARASVGDVSTEAGANAIVEQAIQQYGRVDVVVNNAGILNFSPFGKMSAAVFNETLNVNVGSTFLVTRAAWPHMVRQGYGRVIVFPSQGVFGGLNVAHYSASKGALIGLMRTLALEGKPHGINVNGIIPFAYTDMTTDSLKGGATLAEQGATELFANARKLLDTRLISPAAAWLGHESCEITAEMFHVGGGRVARVFIAEVPGYYDPNLTPESLRDNWPEVCRETGYIVPADCAEPLQLVFQRIGLALPSD